MQLTNVQFLNAGYCLQNEYLTGTGTFRWRRFDAVFVAFEHPIHGRCLIDTGYGPKVLDASHGLPGWLMRRLLYTPTSQPVFDDDFLSRLNLDPGRIQYIFLSHYHTDHIGGLTRFPHSTIICRPQPLRWLQSLSRWRQFHHGFLPGLLPENLDSRIVAIDEAEFQMRANVGHSIPCFDFWGDGSLVLLDLPGHATGHTGYILNSDQGRIAYVVDAFWDVRTFNQQRQLPFPARHVQYNPADYNQTLIRLHQLRDEMRIPLLACHCEMTQTYVRPAN